MKVLIAVSCLLAVASAGIVSPVAYTSWVAPQHLPVMGPNGVPLDTPAVNAAKAQHFHAIAEAKVRNGDHLMYSAAPVAPLVATAPVVATSGIAVAAPAMPVYQGPIHLPVMGPNGVPLDTPEVNAAKINHFHDVAEAKVRNGDHLIAAPVAVAPVAVAPVAIAAAPIHLPVMGPNGVPLDTPAVNAAKAQHFHAVAEAKMRSGHGHWIAKRSLAWAPQHLPVMGPNGVPLDTPAVNAAKAQHFHAIAEAKARNGDHLMYATAPVVATSGIAVPALATPVYQGPIHLPVMGPNGVPLDTPEVNAAKINHFHDVAEAKLRNGDHLMAAPIAVATAPVAIATAPIHLPVMGPNGVPLDTPEVNAAKMAHFAAHARAHTMAY